MVGTKEAIPVAMTTMANNASETEHTGIVLVQYKKRKITFLFYLERHFSSAAQRREYMWALWMYVEA